MRRWKFLKQHGYLVGATATILAAMLALCVIQWFALQRTQREVEETLKANLDLRLVSMVDESRRDMMDRASYITHRLSHNRVRERALDGVACEFARVVIRHPEIGSLFVVFFARGDEQGAWRAYRYAPEAQVAPGKRPCEALAVGAMVEEEATTQALRRACSASPTGRPKALTRRSRPSG